MSKYFYILSLLLCCFSFSSMSQCGSFSMNISQNNPSCYQFSDGSLSVITTGGTGNITYTISDSSGNVLNSGNLNTVNNLTEGWYYIVVTDEVPCTLNDSVFLDAPNEIAIDLVVDEPLCFGDTAQWTYVDTVYNFTGNYNQLLYFWNPCPPPNPTNGTNDTLYQPPGGNYSIIVQDENGCSYQENFIVQSSPSQVGYDSLIYQNCISGGDGSASIYPSGGTPPYTVLWYNNATGDSLYGQSITALDAGVYYYEIYDANGCTLEFVGDSLTIGCVGSQNHSFIYEVYPNPSIGLFKIDLGNNFVEKMSVYNMMGKEIYMKKNISGIVDIDLSHLPSGSYILQLKKSTFVRNEKIVIQH